MNYDEDQSMFEADRITCYLDDNPSALVPEIDCIESAICSVAVCEDCYEEDEDSESREIAHCNVRGTFVDAIMIEQLHENYLHVCDGCTADLGDVAATLYTYLPPGKVVNFYLLEEIEPCDENMDADIKTRVLKEIPRMCYLTFGRIPDVVLYYPDTYAASNQQRAETGRGYSKTKIAALIEDEMPPFAAAGFTQLGLSQYWYAVVDDQRSMHD